MKLKENDPAPAFKLPDQHSKMRSSSEWAGRWTLVYFYPKDDTPGCTKEACLLQSRLQDYGRVGLDVVGISADNVESHRKFAGKYRLTFPLLSDVDKEVVQSYGVWGPKKFMGKEYMGLMRTTFIIGKDGRLKHVMDRVNTKTHHADVCDWIQKHLK